MEGEQVGILCIPPDHYPETHLPKSFVCYPVDRITGKGHNKFTNDLKKLVSVMMNWLFDLDRSIDGEAPDFGGETSDTQT